MKYILALDLGTTAIKVILFQIDGQVVASQPKSISF